MGSSITLNDRRIDDADVVSNCYSRWNRNDGAVSATKETTFVEGMWLVIESLKGLVILWVHRILLIGKFTNILSIGPRWSVANIQKASELIFLKLRSSFLSLHASSSSTWIEKLFSNSFFILEFRILLFRFHWHSHLCINHHFIFKNSINFTIHIYNRSFLLLTAEIDCGS